MLITKRKWKTIVFVNDKGEMTSRVCTNCGQLRLSNSFIANGKGIGGKRPDCLACYNDKHEKTTVIRRHRSRAKAHGMPSEMTLELTEKAKAEQGYKCILTGKTDNLTTDHFTSLSWGTGLGDTYENVIFLDGSINASKGSRNPFIWILTQKREFQLRFYDNLIPMLANRNEMTVKEFEEFVNNEYAKHEEKKGGINHGKI